MGTVTEAKKKPLPNRLCYPEAFKDWKPGMRVPHCKRCDGLLNPNENHECEGYVPKLPFDDMEDHMDFMDDQRESMREEINRQREERREELYELEEQE